MSDDLRFYKIKPINKWLIESIVQRTLFASKPANLNDPFDCQVDLKSVLGRAILIAKGEQLKFIKRLYENPIFFDTWANEISSKGVYSFSLLKNEILSEPLMWSHYADEHRGVCLEYVIPEKFLKEELTCGDVENRIAILNAVNYEDNGFVNCVLSAPREDENFIKTLVSKYLLTKSYSWRYEHEGRLVLMKSGIINLPDGCLKRVYFGLRSTSSDIQLISELANSYSGCNNFYKAVRSDGDYSFKWEVLAGA